MNIWTELKVLKNVKNAGEKNDFKSSFKNLFQIISVKSIYLDNSIGIEMETFKKGIKQQYEGEGWDEYYFRVLGAIDKTVESIRNISAKEMKILT